MALIQSSVVLGLCISWSILSFHCDPVFILTWICPRHFGKDIIARRISYEESDERVQTLWLKLYKVLYVLD